MPSGTDGRATWAGILRRIRGLYHEGGGKHEQGNDHHDWTNSVHLSSLGLTFPHIELGLGGALTAGEVAGFCSAQQLSRLLGIATRVRPEDEFVKIPEVPTWRAESAS